MLQHTGFLWFYFFKLKLRNTVYDLHGLEKVLQHLSFSRQWEEHLFSTPISDVIACLCFLPHWSSCEIHKATIEPLASFFRSVTMCSFLCVSHMPAVFLKATLALLLIIATDRKVISGELLWFPLLSVRDQTSSLSSLKEVLGRSSRQVLKLISVLLGTDTSADHILPIKNWQNETV